MHLTAEQIARIVAEVEACGLHGQVLIVPLATGEVDIIPQRRIRVPSRETETEVLDTSNGVR